MKIPNRQTDFTAFNDGVCEIWSVKNNRLDKQIERLAFSESNTGYKKYYAAAAAGIKLEKSITVPYRSYLKDTGINIVIGNKRYKVSQVQELKNNNPRAFSLSLTGLGVIQNENNG